MVVSIQIVGVKRECAVLGFQLCVALETQSDEIGKAPIGGLGHNDGNLVGAVVPQLAQ